MRRVWNLVVAIWNRGRPRVDRVLAAGRAGVRQFAWSPIVKAAASIWNQLVATWYRGRRRVHHAMVAGRARVQLLAWLIAIAAVLVAIWLTFQHWDWLSDGESGSTTLRNLGLMVAGVIALLFAYWRSRVAERQANTAQQGLLNDRYQKGAEMLGNEVLAVRLGGIYALQRLAEEHPEQYHIQILRLLCAFVRDSTKRLSTTTKLASTKTELANEDEQPDLESQLQEDVRAVIEAIRNRRRTSVGLERREELKVTSRHAPLLDMYTPQEDFQDAQLEVANLSGANLRGADLFGADLRGIDLRGANLEGAMLMGANLCGVKMSSVNLSNAMLSGAKLSSDLSGARLRGADLAFAGFALANLKEADLSGANVQQVEWLSQKQLDEACADPDNPPKLREAVDKWTGEPLIWRGKSIKVES